MKASEKSVKQKEIYRKLTKKGKRIKKDEFLCVFSCVITLNLNAHYIIFNKHLSLSLSLLATNFLAYNQQYMVV